MSDKAAPIRHLGQSPLGERRRGGSHRIRDMRATWSWDDLPRIAMVVAGKFRFITIAVAAARMRLQRVVWPRLVAGLATSRSWPQSSIQTMLCEKD